MAWLTACRGIHLRSDLLHYPKCLVHDPYRMFARVPSYIGYVNFRVPPNPTIKNTAKLYPGIFEHLVLLFQDFG